MGTDLSGRLRFEPSLCVIGKEIRRMLRRGKDESRLAKLKEERDHALCMLLKENSDLASADPVEPCPPATLSSPFRPDLP